MSNDTSEAGVRALFADNFNDCYAGTVAATGDHYGPAPKVAIISAAMMADDNSGALRRLIRDDEIAANTMFLDWVDGMCKAGELPDECYDYSLTD